jgi:hypothetical protein
LDSGVVSVVVGILAGERDELVSQVAIEFHRGPRVVDVVRRVVDVERLFRMELGAEERILDAFHRRHKGDVAVWSVTD